MVTTLVAGAVILGGLSGSASANVGPGGVDVGSVSIIGDTTVNPPDLDGDDTTVESLHAMVRGLARECTADNGLCTLALTTATDAVTAATACLNGMASEAGVEATVTAAMAKVGLDCGGVVRLMSGYARFALQTVNDCTSEANAACHIAFDAARLGIDRAAGCLDGLLSTSDSKTVEGSDPGCASALAMLYREAEGLIALLTGCLNGDADGAACGDVQRIGAYARDGLTGCVGDMWVALTNVQPVPYEPGGPLACYAVLDQVNVAINGWLGRLPELPTTITPTSEEEDCSITVLPPVPSADAEADDDSDVSGAQHDAHIFVPSCAEPEWVQAGTNVTTPPLDTDTDTDLEGPECENATESERYDITRTTGDIKKKYGHESVVNVNVKDTPMELSTTTEVKYYATITVGGETELKTWIGKINAKFGIEAGVERKHTVSRSVTPTVPPKTEMHIVRLLHAKVVEGRYYKKTSDCRVINEFRRIKAPYRERWFVWQEPWNGGPPE